MGEMLCRKGDVIFKEGDVSSNLYKLLSGSAGVFADYAGEHEKLLTKLQAGDYFGEMAVIEIRERSATVVAAEDDTRLRVVDVYDLSEYLNSNTDEIAPIARHLSRRLRELTGDYIEVCDTLRELGRLDTSGDRISEGLLERVRKFARLHLIQKQQEQSLTPQEQREQPAWPGGKDTGVALRTETYMRGDVVFHERDRSERMYCVRKGRIGIYTNYGTERQKLLTELTENMFFGEMGLFEKRHRSATAVALEDHTELEPICEDDLAALYEKNPARVLMLLEHLSGRLRRLTADYLKACKALSAAEDQIERSGSKMTPEALVQIEYMNQLLLMPELMY